MLKADRQFFNWLHLSDWHEGKPEPDRDLLLNRLLLDVRARAALNKTLKEIDAVIFSGDMAFSGKKDEFSRVQTSLINPLKKEFGPECVFIFCPGNHDLNRTKADNHNPNIQNAIIEKQLGGRLDELLSNKDDRENVLRPFIEYYSFCRQNGFPYIKNSLVNARKFDYGRRVGVVSVNTSLCCGKFKVLSRLNNFEQDRWDYGFLSLTEKQIDDARDMIADCELKILAMHHPIGWLHEGEQAIIEHSIVSEFDIVLHGHEHLPRFIAYEGNAGEIKMVPAGASYGGRNSPNPRYTNAYNFGHVSLEDLSGTVFHRRWFEERRRWDRDDRYWDTGESQFVIRSNTKFDRGNRRYFFNIQRMYTKDAYKRPARRADIQVKHELLKIDEREFVSASVGIRFDLYPGGVEECPVRTAIDKRVERIRDPAVKQKAFEFVSMKPPLTFENREGGTFHGSAFVGTDDSEIDYRYQCLEPISGVWTYTLRRFADVFRFTIKMDPNLEYEFVPFGGFPNVELNENFMGLHEFVSDAGHFPFQGLLVQWYKRDHD